MDKCKLSVSMIELGLAGFELKNRLMDEHNARVELADFENIIAFVTYADTERDVDALVDAMLQVAEEARAERAANGPSLRKPGDQARFTEHLFAPAERAMLPRRATLAAHELSRLSDAPGRVCAEVVAPYPPGIPMLYPGEIIDQTHLEIIGEAMSLGAVFRGLAPGPDGNLVVTVVKAGKN